MQALLNGRVRILPASCSQLPNGHHRQRASAPPRIRTTVDGFVQCALREVVNTSSVSADCK
jgi:hypothetical protein